MYSHLVLTEARDDLPPERLQPVLHVVVDVHAGAVERLELPANAVDVVRLAHGVQQLSHLRQGCRRRGSEKGIKGREKNSERPELIFTKGTDRNGI